jgi:hypothetical protein
VSATETTAEWYTRYALGEARDQSATYASWATGVAHDPAMIAAIERLPPQRRQPALLFAVSRLLGAPVGEYAAWRDFTLEHWAAVEREALVRLTQTNEPLRCAALMPVLARIAGPVALLEVGASAGLCLYPDRYSYRYDAGEPLHPADGPSAVMLECTTNGLERLARGHRPRPARRLGRRRRPLARGAHPARAARSARAAARRDGDRARRSAAARRGGRDGCLGRLGSARPV